MPFDATPDPNFYDYGAPHNRSLGDHVEALAIGSRRLIELQADMRRQSQRIVSRLDRLGGALGDLCQALEQGRSLVAFALDG